MATLRKRNGKWQAQVRRAGHTAQSRTFLHRADALKWARQTESELDRGDLPVHPAQLNGSTVGELMRRYRDEVIPRKASRKPEGELMAGLLKQRFTTLPLSRLSPQPFARYRDQRLETVRPATIHRELGLLHHMFEIARREWAIPLKTNPLSEVAKPRLDNRRERRLRGDEWPRLMGAAEQSRNPLIAPLIRLAVETGMRRSELLRLDWSDIDLDKRLLYVRTSKTGEPRIIPLSSKARETFLGLGPNAEGSIFPLTPNAVRLAWERTRRRAGIKDLRFHDLRHEAISRFFEQGLSVPEVALISGHKDPRMLLRYTHMQATEIARKFS